MVTGEVQSRIRRGGRGVLALGLASSLLFLSAACGGDDSADGNDASKAGGSESSSGSSAGASNGSDPGGSGSGASGSGGSGSGGSGSGGSGGTSLPTPSGGDPGAPGTPDAQGRQTDVFDRIPGSKSAGCIQVGNKRDIRSGGFVGGAFDEASDAYGTKRPGFAKKEIRLYWIPLHAGSMKGVQVSASSGGASVKPSRTTQGDADQWKFYDTTLSLPKSGTWTFKVSSGQDRGCFVARIG